MNQKEFNKILKKVDEIEKPLPTIQFDISNQKPTIFNSKIGGMAYFPKDMEYPKGECGDFKDKPLVLLAQINFEEIPNINPFPEKGILQFFIAADDLYGMNWKDLTTQKNFRIIYHKDIIKDESKLLNFMPKDIDYSMLPFKGEYKIMPNNPETMYADMNIEAFNDAFEKCSKEVLGEEYSIYDLEDEFEEKLYDRNSRASVFIGGYPFFTQSDPRYRSEIMDCNIVLLEIDSLYDKENNIDIMWGDAGTGVFLIPREKLRNLDFSKVVYNYDCY